MKKTLDITHPKISKEWHPIKNSFKPNTVTHGSHKKVWWISDCGHEWESRIDARTISNGGCPYCNRSKSNGNLLKTHANLCKFWSTRNKKNPNDFTKGSICKVWWSGECGHEWLASIRNMTNPSKSGSSGCPYCANKSTNESNNLKTLFPEISKEWHPIKNGNLTPNLVNAKTYQEAWWLGECGHEWYCKIRNRTRKVRPTNCPQCKQSKGENYIEDILTKLGIHYEKQCRFKTCKDKRPLPFDFKVGLTLIEYQGIQHYEPIDFGYKKNVIDVFEEIQKRDKIKRDWCCVNGYNLLEISYKEFNFIPQIIKREVYHSSQNSRRS